MKKILTSMLSAAIVSAMLLTGCGSSGSAPAADASAAGSAPAADNAAGTATSYPTKQISMIIQASPGGLSDTNARAIAQLVQEDLGVPVVCTNKPGASGAVAMSFLQASKPDGYTIGYVPVELSMVQALGYATDVYPDAFDLISGCNVQPAAITVRADSGWNSIEDLVNYAKGNPGQLRVGNSGTGSIWQVAGDSFANAAGIEVNQVPFDGAAPAVAGLLGKHIDMVSVSEFEVSSGVASGELKILAVCSEERSKFNPDVPTLKELGYDVNVSAWGGFALPKDTPDDVKDILYASFEKAVGSDSYADLCAKNQYSPMPLKHDEFAAFANEQYEFYKSYFEQNSVT
ncbi:tripartite tricarboxylate transporter substrate binding protein [Anaerotruncus colihominis]|uniref:Tripartite tricarboxylate transporter substrate binding protein n=1 Tax=Anaerotruncus colihominis TaxID=169435 RepID=A0A845SV37_9FIRM|nr:tripartite tricarboxylate transporter substrate binding protein [Anaerotruncus colihominis]MCR2024734.1 tripartite tricarboxylate transporter substrate binding protein [Anaerotruncus colihominis]NDO38204.1 tripartite tricarboxylate transporter substrate binding protein [Anaerotruncus colihominis]